MKELSARVNDTSTAVTCIDYLSVSLSKLATRRLNAPFPTKMADLRCGSGGTRTHNQRLKRALLYH